MEIMSEDDGFLEELLALRRETWEETNPSSNHHQINSCFFSTSAWPTFDGLDSTTASFDSFTSSIDQPPPPLPPTTTTTSLDCSSFFASPFTDPTTFPGPGPVPGPNPEPDFSMPIMDACKTEHSNVSSELELEMPSPSFNIGSFCMDNNISNNNTNTSNNNNNNNKGGSKVKKVEGQPSKNLMAERRRRKRLNDRLSMLRSVVPKISKMDRTSILGDTIEYMKELLERINNLQEEMEVGSNELKLMTIFKDEKPNDVLVRNSPKFDVERKSLDTRIQICCAGKPGLLLSTITTLEALGLEIQQCVISCFNDFSLQASCFEEMEHKSLISSEDIKQALFRNAGYGGRCL